MFYWEKLQGVWMFQDFLIFCIHKLENHIMIFGEEG